ncbi:MAG: hypothetical protein ACI8TP_000831 [Acidimicrobiales bacterium]
MAGGIDTVSAMIDAYCWPQSTAADQTVALMISSDQTTCNVEIVRVGAGEDVVHRHHDVPVSEQPVSDSIVREGCGWEATLQVTVSSSWASGFYLVRLTAPNGESAEAFFVVKASTPGNTLLVLTTSTWAAYNHWGADSFYTGGSISSLERPLPTGFLAKDDPRRFRAAAYVDMPRDEIKAHFRTHSFFSSAAGFANWERLFVAWAESEGISFDYATSTDLATDPELLAPYKLYLSVGHDEYWSASMRDNVEGWVAEGGAALFLSGNTSFWQIRPENDWRRIVGYKFDIDQDPVVGGDSETSVSTMWSDPLCRRPENEMTGVSFTRGGYANMPHAPEGGGYSVHQPAHWVFAGLDLEPGDVVGGDGMVVGYECDGCDFELVDGIPRPTGIDGTPLAFEILATAPAKLWETHEIAAGLANYVGELNWVAERLAGSDTAETRAIFEGGHAVMGTHRLGQGWVFTTGCTDWAYGLDDPTVSGITKNLINRALDENIGQTSPTG